MERMEVEVMVAVAVMERVQVRNRGLLMCLQRLLVFVEGVMAEDRGMTADEVAELAGLLLALVEAIR